MGNYSQLEEGAPFVAMFVGDSGCGKTAAEVSFVEQGPVKLYDLDKRSKGIIGCERFIGKELLEKNLTIERKIDVSNGFEELDKQLTMDGINAKKLAQTGESLKHTVVVDGAGTLSKILLYDSMRIRGATKGAFEGKLRGTLKFPHPDDYNYVSAAIHQLQYNYFLPLRMNFILSGWTVDKWGKDPSQANNDFAGNVVVGKKLAGLTEKLSSEMPGYFDEVYYFAKTETGIATKPLKYTVCFESSIAKTSIPALQGLGEIDITGKSFYRVYQELLNGKKPIAVVA